MTRLCDMVNFNSDASCLDSQVWLSVLKNGEQSKLCQWLLLYLELEKPVSLGFTGATLADINAFNPEAITFLRNNPDIFQIILRPFAHDLPFFRTDEGFCINLSLGGLVAEHLIGRVSQIYLPPEFMQTNRQTALLAQHGVKATLIMGSRFNKDVARRLPKAPFALKGIPGGELICIPVVGNLTKAYLTTIQILDSTIWQKAVAGNDTAVMWRDGESSFLLPDGLERERFWLSTSDDKRTHLQVPCLNELESDEVLSYPVHPFSAWMNELSMLWFVQRLGVLEKHVVAAKLPRMIAGWLQCINSDILSAVEKRSPVIQLKGVHNGLINSYRINRSDRSFEAEAMLEMAEKNYEMCTDNTGKARALARERLICDLLR